MDKKETVYLYNICNRYKLGLSCAKLRSSQASQPAHLHLCLLFSISKLFAVVFKFTFFLMSYYINKFFGDRLPFTKICGVVFHLQIFLRLSSIYIVLRSSSNNKFFWGRLSFPSWGEVRSSSVFKICEVVFHLQKNLRSSSIYKKM